MMKDIPGYDTLRVALLLQLLGGRRTPVCIAQIVGLEQPVLLQILHTLEFLGIARQHRGTCRWSVPAVPSEYQSAFTPLKHDRTGMMLHALSHDAESLEGCSLLYEFMMQLIHQSRIEGAHACLELLIARLNDWNSRAKDSSQLRMYVDLALQCQSEAISLGACMESVQKLPLKAKEIATALGDERSLAQICLVEGCLGNLAGLENAVSPVDLLRNGLDAVSRLGDADIAEQISPYLAFLHYQQGQFEECLNFLDRFPKQKTLIKCRYFSEMYPLFVSPAAMYLGSCPAAIGVAMKALSSARLRGDHHGALWWNTLLAVLYIRIGMKDSCLECLSQVIDCIDAESAPKLYLWVWRTLALYHAETGHLNHSMRIFKNCLQVRIQYGTARFAYTAPWILELIAAYRQAGYPDLPGLSLEQEIDRVLAGPNPNLHGMAWRLLAHSAWQHKAQSAWRQPAPDAIACLEQSLTCFQRCGNGLEEAKSGLLLADRLQAAGKTGKAEQLRRKYRPVLASLTARECCVQSHVPGRGHFWQGYLLPGNTAALADLPEKFSRVNPEGQFEDNLLEILHIMQFHLGAEHGSLLLVAADGTRQNLSDEADTEAETFCTASVLQQLCQMPAAPLLLARTEGVSLLMPVRLPDDSTLIFMLKSTLIAGLFVLLSAEQQQRIAEQLWHVLRMLHGISKIRKNNLDTTTVHGVCVSSVVDNSKIRYAEGSGTSMQLEQARYAAESDAAILILGETGVGKEILARRIHEFSGRKGAFVPVHPASTPEQLFESEFFGFEKGAFTGADHRKAGLFELADGGTFFIDEVGELPLSFQVKLLRVLQDQTFMRVGGTRLISSSFRLVAATNRDLRAEVQKGTFREDLFYRISVIPITIPPLRERREDIPGLLELFIDEFSTRYGRRFDPVTPETVQRFKHYSWPGNVREMKNIVERAVILNRGGPLEFMLESGMHSEAVSKHNLAPEVHFADLPTLAELNARYIRYVLRRTGGKVIGKNGAERILGISRSSLYAKIKALKINKD